MQKIPSSENHDWLTYDYVLLYKCVYPLDSHMCVSLRRENDRSVSSVIEKEPKSPTDYFTILDFKIT